MSIASEISRISQNVADSLTEVAAKGVIVPSGSNSDDLPELIRSIPTGSGSAITVTDEEDEHGGIIRHINAVSLAGITVTAAHLETGYTAVNALGETITGTLDPGGGGGGTYQAKTNINPSTSSQTITPDNGYDALSSVQINAMPAMTLPTSATSSATTGFTSKATISRSTGDQYINIPTGYNAAGAYYKINGTPNMTLPTSTSASATSGYTSKLTVTRSTSDQYINIPTGYNTAGAYYKVEAVPNGTAGTPTATKGTVSNHSVSVTPSVTNTAGYISGGTSTGTAVTVSASELVSGTKTITENGTGIDVTNYATVDVQVSSGGTQVISISDTTDANGGTIRTVTAVDISDTTATASDVASGKYFYTAAGVKTAGTGSGGGGGATQHVIHFEFSDSTDADINVYYDDALIGTMITAYTPETYGQKTVDSAALDNVIWYERPTEVWETLWDGNMNFNYESNGDYPYFYSSSLYNTHSVVVGDVYRVTYNNNTYRCTASYHSGWAVNGFGNPLYSGGIDDGSNVPFYFFSSADWQAWSGGLNVPNETAAYYIKIEHLVSS